MKLFEVYGRFDIAFERGDGFYLYDEDGNQYLDLYTGHGVISIGHSHPRFNAALKEQIDRLIFYSNAVRIPQQEHFAKRLGEVSNYEDFNLFMCNSGAEAVENALKLASFHTGKDTFVALNQSFHGRTTAALSVTDNPALMPETWKGLNVIYVDPDDHNAIEKAFSQNEVAGFIAEFVQGVGGLGVLPEETAVMIRQLCNDNNAVLIADEVQSGFGRTGQFFAHQHYGIVPDIITMGKGIGNGFPVAGVMIHPDIEAKKGMLGTTYGGNPLASVAATAVVDIIDEENLMANAREVGTFIREKSSLPVDGLGLMTGFSLPVKAADVRGKLLFDDKIVTGSSVKQDQLRILPPLSISKEEMNRFMQVLDKTLANVNQTV